MTGSGEATSPVIKQTRRSTIRRLNQLNGDLLPALKKPLCSEVGREVKGQNAGCDVSCRKQVRLFYKEQAINLDHISRSQDAVFQAFLKRYKQQKRLERKTYQHMQEGYRLQFAKSRLLVPSKTHSITEKDPTRDPETAFEENPNSQEGVGEISGTEHKLHSNNQAVVTTTPPRVITGDDGRAQVKEPISGCEYTDTKPPGPASPTGLPCSESPTEDVQARTRSECQKSKVVEVQKGIINAPLTRERSNGFMETNDNKHEGEKPSPSKPHSFPKIDELFPLKDRSNVEAEPAQTQFSDNSVATDESSLLSAPPISPGKQRRFGCIQSPVFPARRSTGSVDLNVLPVIPETVGGPGTEHLPPSKLDNQNVVSPERLPSSSSQQEPVGLHGLLKGSADVSGSSALCCGGEHVQHRMHESLVHRNKRLAKEHERKRKECLDREAPVVYTRSSRGEIVVSGVEFKKRQFEPPSQREKYFQQKMLRAQQEARLSQRERVESFFRKVYNQDEALTSSPKVSPAKKESVVEDKRSAQRAKDTQTVGVTLSQMMAVFQQAPPREDVDPNSAEALKTCHYVRLYSPGSTEGKPAARRDRRTSWGGQQDKLSQLTSSI